MLKNVKIIKIRPCSRVLIEGQSLSRDCTEKNVTNILVKAQFALFLGKNDIHCLDLQLSYISSTAKQM